MDKGGQGEKLRVVVDASVAAKWIIPGEPWDTRAKALKDGIASGEVDAFAPPLIPYEVASVVLKSVSIGVLKLDAGLEALKAIGNLGVKVQSIDWKDVAEILSIASSAKLTVYDSTYLWLSKKLGAKLVTADRDLAEKGRIVTETALLKDLNLI